MARDINDEKPLPDFAYIDTRSLRFQWSLAMSVFPEMAERGYPWYHPKTWHVLVAVLIKNWELE